MRVLVTGGNGYIGRYVCRELKDLGIEFQLLTNIDLLEATGESLESGVFRESFTHLIHLAWYTNHSDYLANPINKQWVEATKILINSFWQSCKGRAFIAGTCFEDENLSDSLYGTSKRQLREYFEDNHPSDDWVWGQIHYIFGPGESKTRLVPAMIDSALNQNELELREPNAIRDYIYVQDLAKQIVKSSLNNYQGALHLGSGRGRLLGQIQEDIHNLINQKPCEDRFVNECESENCIIADISIYESRIDDISLTPWKESLEKAIQGVKS